MMRGQAGHPFYIGVSKLFVICGFCGIWAAFSVGCNRGQTAPLGATTQHTAPAPSMSGMNESHPAESSASVEEPLPPEGADVIDATTPTDSPAKNDITNSVPKFCIATYNINWGNPDLPTMAGTIRAAEADVVCLQETTPESELFLRQQFGNEYPEIRFVGDDGAYRAERFGILSQLPIVECDYHERREGLFGFWIIDVRLDDRTIRLANVHLTPFDIDSEGGVPIWVAMQAVEDVHETEIQRVLESTSGRDPTIVLGDFNSTVWMAAPTALVEHGYVDSFAALHEQPESEATWHWFLGDVELQARIDYIFSSRHFRAVDSQIVASEASDHHLLYTRFEWLE